MVAIWVGLVFDAGRNVVALQKEAGMGMSKELKTTIVGALAGAIGVLVGAIATGYFSYKVANVQFKQAIMTTAAASALSVRNTLAEKAAAFFLANEAFLRAVRERPLDRSMIRDSITELDKARSNLAPYLDADLLLACEGMAESARLMFSGDLKEGEGEQYIDGYKLSFNRFTTLYLSLRRDLEKHAQLNVLASQLIDEQQD